MNNNGKKRVKLFIVQISWEFMRYIRCVCCWDIINNFRDGMDKIIVCFLQHNWIIVTTVNKLIIIITGG